MQPRSTPWLAAALLSLTGSSVALAVQPNQTPRSAPSQEKKKPTVASITARRDALLKVRDGLRGVAATPAPKGLSEKETAVYAEFVAKAREVADGCDGLANKLTAGLKAKDAKLDSLSEMGEMESLRLQMAMDRMSKTMSTVSNLLKKASETANSITQNLK
jgi:hypothetical protein